MQAVRGIGSSGFRRRRGLLRARVQPGRKEVFLFEPTQEQDPRERFEDLR